MKTTHTITRIAYKTLATISLLASTSASFAGTASQTIDTFSDAQNNDLGIARQFMDDTLTGGKTSTTYNVADGVLSAKGELVPPRGQPGWASAILVLEPQGLPVDASAFEGIRLLVKINSGNLSISANSTDITNFDYHTFPVARKSDGKFHEVKIPFAKMKRAWSEQTPLNAKTIATISLVAVDLQPGSFDFEVDEVSFY